MWAFTKPKIQIFPLVDTMVPLSDILDLLQISYFEPFGGSKVCSQITHKEIRLIWKKIKHCESSVDISKLMVQENTFLF